MREVENRFAPIVAPLFPSVCDVDVETTSEAVISHKKYKHNFQFSYIFNTTCYIS